MAEEYQYPTFDINFLGTPDTGNYYAMRVAEKALLKAGFDVEVKKDTNYNYTLVCRRTDKIFLPHMRTLLSQV